MSSFRKFVAVFFLVIFASPATATDVVVLAGLQEHIEWLESQNWWGEVHRGEDLLVPHALITGIPANWGKEAGKLPVAIKKELFYRYMAPLILHANAMVMQRRERLAVMEATLASEGSLSTEDREWLQLVAPLLRIDAATKSDAEFVKEALYKLDIIPAGLALGQAAYESGYGTSRFAAEGNALFGQWTFGGEGLTPQQQRKELGDHRIASFEWPFDSVRGYFLNINSHPAYEPFRKLRAKRRANGLPLTSDALADGLISYSERGQEYVDTLKSIIRVNKLDIADEATLGAGPPRFVVGAASEEDAIAIRKEIEKLRASGELDAIVGRMRLE